MSKIEEFIEKSGIFFEYESDKMKMTNVMKEYAEWYLGQYKQAILNEYLNDPDDPEFGLAIVDDRLINELPNPPHN